MGKDKLEVIGGVDTHLKNHVAAVIDVNGRILGTDSFPASLAGYTWLLRWLDRFGEIQYIGIEGTGSYGMGLVRRSHEMGVGVVEVTPTCSHASGGPRGPIRGEIAQIVPVDEWVLKELAVSLWTARGPARTPTCVSRSNSRSSHD